MAKDDLVSLPCFKNCFLVKHGESGLSLKVGSTSYLLCGLYEHVVFLCRMELIPLWQGIVRRK